MQVPSILFLAESRIPYSSQYFHISVGSATYDRFNVAFLLFVVCLGGFRFFSLVVFRIEKDIRVTTEAALGLIGGTMGLFTGHSIITRSITVDLWSYDICILKYPCMDMWIRAR